MNADPDTAEARERAAHKQRMNDASAPLSDGKWSSVSADIKIAPAQHCPNCDAYVIRDGIGAACTNNECRWERSYAEGA